LQSSQAQTGALGQGQGQGQGQGHSPKTQSQSLSLPPSSILSPLRNTTRSPIGLVPTTPAPSQLPDPYNSNQNNIPQNGRSSPYMQHQASISSSHQQQYSNSSSDIDPYSSSSMHRRKGISGGRSEDLHGQYEDESESAGPASMLFQQQQQAQHVDQVSVFIFSFRIWYSLFITF
jgi:hypothetical protein